MKGKCNPFIWLMLLSIMVLRGEQGGEILLNALIVEDEIMIRKGLEKHVHWKALGFHEVRSASCAQEALQICQE